MNATDDCVFEAVGNWMPSLIAFSAVYVFLGASVLLTSVVMWLLLMNRLVYLKKRGVSLLLLLALGWTSNLITGPLSRTMNDREAFIQSCGAANTTFLLVLPCFALAALTRVVMFRNKAYLHKLLASTDYQENPRKINRAWFYASDTFGVIFAFTSFLVSLGIVIGLNFRNCPEFGADECILATVSDPLIAVFLLVFFSLGFVVFIYVTRQLRNYPDPFDLLREVSVALRLIVVLQIPAVIFSSLNLGAPTEQEEVYFAYGILYDIPVAIVGVYLITYQIYKAQKFNQFRAVYSKTSLEKVLKDPTGKELFKLHLLNEFSVENLNFLDDVKEFREITNPIEQATKANEIFNEFIKLRRLNISADERTEIERNVEESTIESTMFDRAFDSIFDLLESDSFRRFQNTPTFLSYVGLNSGSSAYSGSKNARRFSESRKGSIVSSI